MLCQRTLLLLLVVVTAVATGTAKGMKNRNGGKKGVKSMNSMKGMKGMKGMKKKGMKEKGMMKDDDDDEPEPVDPVLTNVVGAVFSGTNTPPADLTTSFSVGSQLVMYHQLTDGTLRGPVGRYATGGTGINAGTSQDSIIVSGNQVFIANGSNNPTNPAPEGRTSGTVSRFVYDEYGALLTSNVPSGGENPIALALCGSILYVCNAAFINGLNLIFGPTPPHPTLSASITALQIHDDGTMTPIPELTIDLGQGARPVDIALSDDNKHLVVAQSALFSDRDSFVRSYGLDGNCRLSGQSSTSGPGEAIIPLAVHLLTIGGVNYMYSGNAGDGSMTAFKIQASDGALQFINKAVGPGPGAALCWVAIIRGKYLYTTNAAISTVSTFEINQTTGGIALLDVVEVAYPEGGNPLDMWADGNYLYILLLATGEIFVYFVEEDGTLTQRQNIGGLPGNPSPDADFLSPLGLTGGAF
jgi:6-phosphogluconolactonase